MGNIDADPMGELAPFRKIAVGTWGAPDDPQIYGTLKVRAEAALAYVAELRARTGARVTLTHLVVKAVGAALAACPDANVVLRLGRPHRRRSVDVSVLVAHADGERPDLSATKLVGVDGKGVADLARELDAAAGDVRAGRGSTIESGRRLISRLPPWLVRVALRLVTFFSYSLNLDLSRLGVPRDPFGGAVVSSLGSLGLEGAFIPLVGYSGAPIVVAAGAVADEPVVEDGRVVPGKVLRLHATFDHRVIDGTHAAVLAAALRRALERPAEVDVASGLRADAAVL
jgi:pyruvate dehydrogenase E2 component (dihydrolipoamide acetyltransferase)